jgi:dipeptidyl aminopeptidase/acylaminoacyl peptidase
LFVTVHEGEARFRIDVLILATGARRTVIAEGFDAQYVPTGHLVYAKGAALVAVPFDLERLEVSGPAVQLIDGVTTMQRDGVGHYALSDTGTLVFAPRAPAARRTLAWVDRNGGTTPLPLEPRPYWTPRLSPDGRQFAVVVREDEASHIWVQRFDRETFSRVTQQGQNWAPVWSPDGSQLIYASQRSGLSHLMRQPADGSAPPEILLTSETHEVVPGTLTLDGRSLIYVQRSPTGDAQLRALDLSSRQTEALDDLPARVGMPARSPDGRWLGFTAWTPIRPSVFVRPLGRQGPARLLVEAAGYTVWSRTGDRLFFRSRRGSTEGATDGIFELPFDPVRGVVTGPERQRFRKSFTDWLGRVSMSRLTVASFWSCRTNRSPSLVT